MKPIEMLDALLSDEQFGGEEGALYKELREKIEAMTTIADILIAGMIPYQLGGEVAATDGELARMKAAIIQYDPVIEPMIRDWGLSS